MTDTVGGVLESTESLDNEKVDAFLQHYGIKGMKWGVRRDRRVLDRLAGRNTKASKLADLVGRSSKAERAQKRQVSQKEFKSTLARKHTKADTNQFTNKTASKDHKRADNVAQRLAEGNGYSTLSNAEIRAYLERVDLNRRLNQLEKDIRDAPLKEKERRRKERSDKLDRYIKQMEQGRKLVKFATSDEAKLIYGLISGSSKSGKKGNK